MDPDVLSHHEANITSILPSKHLLPANQHSYTILTSVIHREMYVGLGLQLREWLMEFMSMH